MTFRLAYNNSDGVACIVYAVPKERIELELGLMTDAEYRDHVIARSIPPGVAYVKLSDKWTPPPREQRNAWTVRAGKVEIDAAKASPPE